MNMERKVLSQSCEIRSLNKGAALKLHAMKTLVGVHIALDRSDRIVEERGGYFVSMHAGSCYGGTQGLIYRNSTLAYVRFHSRGKSISYLWDQ